MTEKMPALSPVPLCLLLVLWLCQGAPTLGEYLQVAEVGSLRPPVTPGSTLFLSLPGPPAVTLRLPRRGTGKGGGLWACRTLCSFPWE